MHPAFSVIFFTTASGAGYGMLIMLGLLTAAGVLSPDLRFGIGAFGVALILITAGLLSSTAHLGHPERAWRAFSQWRSSWLSREGVLAVVTYGPAVLLALLFCFAPLPQPLMGALGIATAALALLTVICTGMIYASLKTIRAWCNPWVVPNYIMLGLLTGMVWLNALMLTFGMFWPPGFGIMLVLMALGFLFKRGYWTFLDSTAAASTPETATGLGHLGKVRLLDAPHSQSNYLMREMGYAVARKHAAKLRVIAQLLLVFVPAGFVVLSFFIPKALVIACAWVMVASVSLGVVVERWLFFAEAKHAVTLYYGAESV